MGDAPPVGRDGGEFLAPYLGLGADVPQTEFDPQLAIGLHDHRTDRQALGIDGPPIGEIGHRVDVIGVVDKGFGVNRAKQAGALQVGPHHARDIGAAAACRAADGKIGNGNGQGLEIALSDVHRQGGESRPRQDHRQH